MADTETSLKEDLERVREAKRSGARSVTFANGEQIQRRSVRELDAVEADLVRRLNAVTGKRRPRAFRVTASKGL